MSELPQDPAAPTESAPQPDRPDRDGTAPKVSESPMDEAPDIDTTAWEGAEPDDAVGLVDPRHEVPNPPGL